MNELTKTGLFAGVAILLIGLTYATTTPTSINIESEAAERIGESLFPKFTKPLDLATLKIVKYNESLGQLKPFEVVKDSKNGVWTLPGHDSYPADAQDQLSKTTNSLVGTKILGLASSLPDDQKLYGVVEPNVEKVEIGQSGVGLLVQMLDEKGERLADLIIGKKVKDSETQRYVRVSTNDQIYLADVDPKVFSTQFKDWIDKDLLQLSSTDIHDLNIRNYDILVTARGGQLARQMDAQVRFETSDGKWQPLKIFKYTDGKEQPVQLKTDEELNTTKLNAMKTALDSLQIVDVARKPEGLAADLKADQALINNKDNVMSLQEKGFFPQPTPDGGMELLASSGELLVSLQDGVQYALRFGDSSETSINLSDDEDEATAAKDILSTNRYLLVSVRLDENQIPPVELETVPTTIEELDAANIAAQPPAAPEQPALELPPAEADNPKDENDAADVDEPAEENDVEPKDDIEPAVEEVPVEATPDAANDQSSTLKTAKARLIAFQDQTDTDVPDTDDAAKTEEPAATEEATKPEDNKPADAAAEETEQEKQERLAAAQEKIRKANQRKTDTRNDKLEKAKKRVAELNARFAEWYYVISESQYEKLKISLDDLVVNKNAANAPTMPAGPPGGFDFQNFGQ